MKNTFGGFLRNSPPIIMGGVLMFRSERMRRTGARSTASGTSSNMQSWADCITGTHVSSFWKRQLVRRDYLVFIVLLQQMPDHESEEACKRRNGSDTGRPRSPLIHYTLDGSNAADISSGG